MFLILCLMLLSFHSSSVSARYDSERILLRDLSAITLYSDRMTTGRRSSPVQQLKCIGGSAGCSTFKPQVVQCKNVGFDGYDVQWECKTDMDDSYRFGKVQVSCEGYDYPDDPYILKGSCGLEYTIDYTEAGKGRQHSNSWDYGTGHQGYGSNVWKNDTSSSGSWFLFFVIVFAVGFLIYKMTSSADCDYSHTRRPNPDRGTPSAPPQYGFKPEYSATHNQYDPPPYEDATRTSTHTSSSTHHGQNSMFGGFWSGLGLGGLGGYLFGNRRNNYGYAHRPYGWGGGGMGYGNRGGNSWGSSWGSSTTHRSHSGGRSSSGTSRTASGFGGTTRR